MTAVEIAEQVMVDPELKAQLATLLSIAAKPQIQPMAFYTYKEVAAALSVGYSTVSIAVQNKRLHPEYVGSEPRLRGREILRWLRDGGTTGQRRHK